MIPKNYTREMRDIETFEMWLIELLIGYFPFCECSKVRSSSRGTSRETDVLVAIICQYRFKGFRKLQSRPKLRSANIVRLSHESVNSSIV